MAKLAAPPMYRIMIASLSEPENTWLNCELNEPDMSYPQYASPIPIIIKAIAISLEDDLFAIVSTCIQSMSKKILLLLHVSFYVLLLH